MFCSKCGAEVKDDMKFCSECGASLSPSDQKRRIITFDKEAFQKTAEDVMDKAGSTLNKAYSVTSKKTEEVISEAKEKKEQIMDDYQRYREESADRKQQENEVRRSQAIYNESANTLSLGEWFIILVLMSIPFINIIVGIVLILSENKTKKYYALAALIYAIIKFVIMLILIAAGASWLQSTPFFTYWDLFNEFFN